MFELQFISPRWGSREWDTGPESVVRVCICPDGKQFAIVTSSGNIHIHNLADGVRRKSFQEATTINTLCFDPSGAMLVTGSEDRTIRIRLLRDEVVLPAGHGVGFGGDNDTVAVGGAAWNARTGLRIGGAGVGKDQYSRMAISSNGQFISNGHLLLDLKSGITASIGDFTGGLVGAAYNVAFSPDGRLIAVVGNRPWDVYETDSIRSLEIPRPIDGNTQLAKKKGGMWSTSVSFSPDGHTFAVGFGNTASGGRSGQVELWDLEGKRLLRIFSRHFFSVWGLTFSPDGRFLAGACGSYFSQAQAGEVKIWEVSTGREVKTLGGYSTCLWGVSYSPDGKRLATASGHWSSTTPHGEVRIWDLTTNQEIISLPEDGTVYGVAYSKDGKRLAVVGTGKLGRIWGPP
jgi:WD40 repeat protein